MFQVCVIAKLRVTFNISCKHTSTSSKQIFLFTSITFFMAYKPFLGYLMLNSVILISSRFGLRKSQKGKYRFGLPESPKVRHRFDLSRWVFGIFLIPTFMANINQESYITCIEPIKIEIVTFGKMMHLL